MISSPDALAALAIGLAGAGHCLGMCGGIAAALHLGNGHGSRGTIAYHGGRLLSYSLLGAVLAGAASSINIASWTLALRYLAALLLIAMGLAIGNWWRGITLLERLGSQLWQPVQRLLRPLIPLRHWSSALVLGLAWGLMPCGLIYSALAWSATAPDALEGGQRMLLFGVGTLPAMVGAGFAGGRVRQLLQQRGLKVVVALLLVASGLWTLTITARHAGHLTMPYGASEHAAHH